MKKTLNKLKWDIRRCRAISNRKIQRGFICSILGQIEKYYGCEKVNETIKELELEEFGFDSRKKCKQEIL